MSPAYKVSRDVNHLKFSKILLNPDPKYGIVFCPKCDGIIENRSYLMNGMVYCRCVMCDICYYISKDRQRSKKLEAFA